MGLSAIFGRPKMTYKAVATQPPVSECCVGRELMPRWRGPQVMEDDSLAMGWVCHRCGREFLPGDVHNRRLIRGTAPVPTPAQLTHAEQPSHDETPEQLAAEAHAAEADADLEEATPEDKA